MINSRPIIWLSSSSHQSGFSYALMSPRPKFQAAHHPGRSHLSGQAGRILFAGGPEYRKPWERSYVLSLRARIPACATRVTRPIRSMKVVCTSSMMNLSRVESLEQDLTLKLADLRWTATGWIALRSARWHSNDMTTCSCHLF